MRKLVFAFAVFVLGVMLPFALHGATAATTLPSSMDVLGDSIAQGYGSDGSSADVPADSFATGTNPSVDSQFLRLEQAGSSIDAAHAINRAVSGVQMASIAGAHGQASEAVADHAGYVVIEAGTNDICTGSASTMTSTTDFRSEFTSALQTLAQGLPSSPIEVMSIPNWYALYEQYGSSFQSTWNTTDNCASLFSAGATSSDRSQVDQRIQQFNAILQTECERDPNCTYDGGATYGFPWQPSLMDPNDDFHLSAAGQAELASLTWAASPVANPPATIGNPHVGASTIAGVGTDFVDVSGPFPAPTSGTISKLTGYLGGDGDTSGPSSAPIRGVVYADDNGRPGALLAVSQQISIGNTQVPGWVDLPFASPVTLRGGSYWIGYWIGAKVAEYYYDATPGSEYYVADTYSSTGLPNDPFAGAGGAQAADSLWSLYATISSSGSGGGTTSTGTTSTTQTTTVATTTTQTTTTTPTTPTTTTPTTTTPTISTTTTTTTQAAGGGQVDAPATVAPAAATTTTTTTTTGPVAQTLNAAAIEVPDAGWNGTVELRPATSRTQLLRGSIAIAGSKYLTVRVHPLDKKMPLVLAKKSSVGGVATGRSHTQILYVVRSPGSATSDVAFSLILPRLQGRKTYVLEVVAHADSGQTSTIDRRFSAS